MYIIYLCHLLCLLSYSYLIGGLFFLSSFLFFSFIFYILLVLKAYKNYIRIEIKKYTVEISDYDSELSIVFLSDIHLSELRTINYAKEIVEKVNNLSADCIFIGGDTIDSHMEYLENKIFDQILKKIKSKYGVYGVLGNHEYIGNLNKNIEYLDRYGIKILRDKSIIINKLEFILRDDKINKSRKKLRDIYISNYPKVVIDHRPILDETLTEGVKLQLSVNNTHGGQIFPINLGYMLKYKIIYGYRKIKDTIIIVFSGVGLK